MTHHVAFLLVPDFQLLDMSGPAAVFQTAGRFARTAAGPAYRVHVVSEHGGEVRSSCGIGVQTRPWRGTPADTLVVPGGEGARETAVTAALRARLRAEADAGFDPARRCAMRLALRE